jgi:hypothetical protein
MAATADYSALQNRISSFDDSFYNQVGDRKAILHLANLEFCYSPPSDLQATAYKVFCHECTLEAAFSECLKSENIASLCSLHSKACPCHVTCDTGLKIVFGEDVREMPSEYYRYARLHFAWL